MIDTTMFDFKGYYDMIAEWLPDNCRLAEIGVANGASSLYLAERLHSLGKKFTFYLIDNLDYGRENQLSELMDNIVATRVKINDVGNSIKFIPLSSLDASCKFNGESLNFIFLDSSHLYLQTKSEIRLWWDKVLNGGILAGHDYMAHAEVKQAVDEVIPVTFTRPQLNETIFEPTEVLKIYKTDSNFGVWEAKKDFFIKLNN